MTKATPFLHTHQRQVHLDFHTSPSIPDVAADFDAHAFAQVFANAHVNSVTVFAKCHHGQCYYPTQTGTQHPALVRQGGRDLLGEQIEALHARGIRAPIYTTVAWEEDAAQRFPQWRQMRADGTFAQVKTSADAKTVQPGGWRFLDFTHPDYLDYIEAHVREILSRYGDGVDGFFFDIVMYDADAGWSDSSRKFRLERGLTGTDSATHDALEAAAQTAFGERFTRLVRDARPQATVFYNSHTYSSLEPPTGPVGIRARQPFQTPPTAEAGPFAAVVGGERFVYFADPVFREVRQTGNLAVRDGLRTAFRSLVGSPAFGAGLPTTVVCAPRRRGADLLLTLLHYVPVRKALDIDMIEERMGFGGIELSVPGAQTVRVFGTGESLKQRETGMFALPVAFGRLLLKVPEFFRL